MFDIGSIPRVTELWSSLSLALTTRRNVPMQSPDGSSITICCATNQTLKHWSQAHSNRSRSLKIPPRRFDRYILPTPSCRVQRQFAYSVTIDSQLTSDKRTTNVVQSCNDGIRSLRHICSWSTKTLLPSWPARLSLLDSTTVMQCYTEPRAIMPTVYSASRINSLARLLCNAPYRGSSQSLRNARHWLPIEQRIRYKIAVIITRLQWWLTYKALLHQQPHYLRELINNYLRARSLRSSNNALLCDS